MRASGAQAQTDSGSQQRALDGCELETEEVEDVVGLVLWV